MKAAEIIEQIRELPADEQAQVIRFVTENIHSSASRKFSVATASDGLPVIHANGGIITSQMVREIETLTS